MVGWQVWNRSCITQALVSRSRQQGQSPVAKFSLGLWAGMGVALLGTLPSQAQTSSSSVPFGTLPTVIIPSTPSSSQQELVFQAPLPMNSTVNRYLVFINSDNPLLLDQVRQVEPGAFRKVLNGQTGIQAGLFTDQLKAQQRVNELQARGIGGSQILATTLSDYVGGTGYPVDGSGLVTTPSTPSNVTVLPPDPPSMRARYFVVIPNPPENLPAIADKVRYLSSNVAIQILQRQVPLGPHVAVGPFAERGSAERWNSYLREFGLDARVYFGR